mgnify:CR=1 FL=1
MGEDWFGVPDGGSGPEITTEEWSCSLSAGVEGFLSGYGLDPQFGSVSSSDWFGDILTMIGFAVAYGSITFITLDAPPSNTSDIQVTIDGINGGEPFPMSWDGTKFTESTHAAAIATLFSTRSTQMIAIERPV